MPKRPFVVTVDGPAGVGKSTLAKLLARKIKICYLDTGAMFRTIALHVGSKDNLEDADLEKICAGLHFTLEGYGETSTLCCNGSPLGSEIRTEAIGLLASRLGQRGVVRTFLARAQRSLGEQTPLVAEGRDMGTVIFPDAACKFFLDARPEVRALRRLNDPKNQDKELSLEQLTTMIRERDALDRNRTLAPLKPADDAIILDTSDLTLSQVLEKMLTNLAVAQLTHS